VPGETRSAPHLAEEPLAEVTSEVRREQSPPEKKKKKEGKREKREGGFQNTF